MMDKTNLATMRGWARIGGLLACLWVTASCSGALPNAVRPDLDYEPDGQTKCRTSKSHERPLIVEWPASDRADLEALLHKGVVAVQYTGCQMRVLPECAAPGAYSYRGTTRELERDTIRTSDELYARLPIGALKFETMVDRGAELTVEMTVVGKYVADRTRIGQHDLVGRDCRTATHVITGLTAGAFEFFSSGRAMVGADLAVAGGKSGSERVLLRKAGEANACGKSRRDATEPPTNCGALLRVEVSRVQCAPGTAFREDKGCVPTRSRSSTVASKSHKGLWPSFVSDSGRAIMASARGHRADARWSCSREGDLRTTTSATRKRVASLGPNPEVVGSAVMVRLEAALGSREDPGSPHHLGLDVFVMMDPRGKVRVIGHAEKVPGNVRPDPTRGKFWTSTAGLNGRMARWLVKRFTATPCAVPKPTRKDLLALPIPASQKRETAKLLSDILARTDQACQMTGHTQSRWVAKFERAGVLLRAGPLLMALESPVRTDGDRLCLGKVTATKVDG